MSGETYSLTANIIKQSIEGKSEGEQLDTALVISNLRIKDSPTFWARLSFQCWFILDLMLLAQTSTSHFTHSEFLQVFLRRLILIRSVLLLTLSRKIPVNVNGIGWFPKTYK